MDLEKLKQYMFKNTLSILKVKKSYDTSSLNLSSLGLIFTRLYFMQFARHLNATLKQKALQYKAGYSVYLFVVVSIGLHFIKQIFFY